MAARLVAAVPVAARWIRKIETMNEPNKGLLVEVLFRERHAQADCERQATLRCLGDQDREWLKLRPKGIIDKD